MFENVLIFMYSGILEDCRVTAGQKRLHYMGSEKFRIPFAQAPICETIHGKQPEKPFVMQKKYRTEIIAKLLCNHPSYRLFGQFQDIRLIQRADHQTVCQTAQIFFYLFRSEERRVGKE